MLLLDTTGLITVNIFTTIRKIKAQELKEGNDKIILLYKSNHQF